MKKILMVINTLGHAGAETALIELLRHLDLTRYQVDLFVLLGQGEMISQVPPGVRVLNSRYSDCSVLSREGKALLRRHALRTLMARGTVFRLAPYMLKQAVGMLKRKRLQPDKLLWRAMAAGAERFPERYDLAVAYLEGGATYYVADHVNADRKAAFVHVDYGQAGYTRSLDQGCYEEFDRIFAVSDEVRGSFLEIYPEYAQKTEVFHNLLNQARIREKAQEAGGFTDSFDGYRLLTVGRLTPQKSFEVSVQAMKLLKDAGEKVRWYILGEGEERGKLEARIRELGLEKDFLLPGAVENPFPYMVQADIYVHATRFEGKSIAIQEAQTLGRAMLVSDRSGNREQVIHGEDGLLCELTPEGIRDGVSRLLHDPALRERLGQAASRKQVSDVRELEKLLSLIHGGDAQDEREAQGAIDCHPGV